MTVQISKKIKGYSVLTPGQPAPLMPANLVSDEADRRLRLDDVQLPVSNSLRWEHRPKLDEGNDARVFQITGPEHKFYVIVGHLKNGTPVTGEPFEVLIAGEAPRGLHALAKSLSLDMRSLDRTWLKEKLESIAKTDGKAFDMTMPNGTVVEMPSEVAAFARLVHYQCEQLGAFTEAKLAKDTSLMDALMSKRRPRTTTSGGLAWYCDVHNQNTGDKFKVFLPELDLGNGKTRPYEVWFDGVYPLQSFRGLAKCLSLDFQVNDLAWVVRKLNQLRTITEDQGEFWATIPGQEKSRVYPSTIAYVAELILHRLRMLNLIDEQGSTGASRVVSIRPQHGQQPSVVQQKGIHMLDCPDCKAKAKVKLDGGCKTCTECSWSSCS